MGEVGDRRKVQREGDGLVGRLLQLSLLQVEVAGLSGGSLVLEARGSEVPSSSAAHYLCL